MTLPAKEAYEWQTDKLNIIINPPDRPNILPNDGYDATFHLYHPNENNNFQEATNATFRFAFDSVAIPTVVNLSFEDGELLEGADSKITATLRNDGTAMARKVSVELICDGVEVKEPASLETEYLSTEKVLDLEWEVTTDELDWWTQSSDVSCELFLRNITGLMMKMPPRRPSDLMEKSSRGRLISELHSLQRLA